MKINSTLAKKLKAYSALAGVVAVAPMAVNAQIIYTNVEPDKIVTAAADYAIDLNSDGISDFNLHVTRNVYTSSTSWSIDLLPNVGNGILGSINSSSSSNSYRRRPLKLIKGDTINPSKWIAAHENIDDGSGGITGSGYFGLRFLFKAQLYYGWVRFYIPSNASSITIKDFAYNNIPDSSIIVGETPCNSSLLPPEITQQGDTLLAHGTGTAHWHINGDSISVLVDTLLIHPVQGIYNVVFTDTFGCNSQSFPVNFLKCDSIDKSIITTSATTYCGKEIIQLYFQYPKQGFTYQWEKNNLKIPGATNSSYKTSIDSSSDFRVIIAPQLNGCYDTSAILHFTIFPLPPPPVVTQHLDTLWSSFQSNYQWNLQVCPYGYCHDSIINGATEQFYLPPPSKDGNYSVTYTDLNGCKVTGRKLFDHCYYFKPPRLITAYPSASVCTGDTVTLFGPIGNYKYQWVRKGIGDYFIIGGDIPGASSNEYRTDISGTYYLRLDSTSCKLNSTELEVDIDNTPVSVKIFQNADTLIATAAFTYQWYSPDGKIIPGATNQSYVPPMDGLYAVEVKNEGGCISKKATFDFRKCHH